MQTSLDAAVSKRAELQISGDASFVDLAYLMLNNKNRDMHRTSHLSEMAREERVPIAKSFRMNRGDELLVYCCLADTNGTASIRILVENKECRAYELTPKNPSAYLSHRCL
jgi:hypothetical protein